eukprot:EG_transcript_10968
MFEVSDDAAERKPKAHFPPPHNPPGTALIALQEPSEVRQRSRGRDEPASIPHHPPAARDQTLVYRIKLAAEARFAHLLEVLGRGAPRGPPPFPLPRVAVWAGVFRGHPSRPPDARWLPDYLRGDPNRPLPRRPRQSNKPWDPLSPPLLASERTLPAALSAPPGPSSLESDVAGQPPLPMLLDDLSDQEQDSTPNPLEHETADGGPLLSTIDGEPTAPPLPMLLHTLSDLPSSEDDSSDGVGP